MSESVSIAPRPPPACFAGQAPVEIGREIELFLNSLVVDQSFVYWNDYAGDGSVYRVPKTGGNAVALRMFTEIAPNGLVANDTHLFWIVTNFRALPSQIVSMPKTGGERQVLGERPHASFDEGPYKLAIDDRDLYFTVPDPVGSVEVISLTGGSPRTVATHQPYANQVALDDDSIYWTRLGAPLGSCRASGAVLSAPKNGGDPIVLAMGEQCANAIAVDETNLYWGTSAEIHRMPKRGGSIEVLARDLSNVWSIALDASNVYFTEWTGKKVGKVSKNGGGHQVLVDEHEDFWPQQLAVDDSCIYWTENSAKFPALGKLMKAPKK